MSIATLEHSLIDKAKLTVQKIFEQDIPFGVYTYHSFDHTMQVFEAAKEIAELSGLSNEDIEIIGIACLFHDVGFSETYRGHEDASMRLAEIFLRDNAYPKEGIQMVLDCIEVTKVNQKPKGKLEEIVKDADLSSLGKRSYFEQAERLRMELNDVQNEDITPEAWQAINVEFLTNHSYYTPEAKLLFRDRKLKNLERLKRLIGEDSKEKKSTTIATSKSAQTQFKTALRNHIDLSSIADNKANIMLSVNALIITIALPVLGNSIRANPNLLIPTIVLLFVCVISIVFATLATRPIKMKGKTTIEDIAKEESNLFFFGNFYNMSFEEYSGGINTVVSDEKLLDSSIIRDLFFLGKALGRKYFYLRLCYNFFMYGIILVVIAFIVGFAV